MPGIPARCTVAAPGALHQLLSDQDQLATYEPGLLAEWGTLRRAAFALALDAVEAHP